MEKTALELKPAKEIMIDFQGNEIKVKPYLTVEDRIFLTDSYIVPFFQPVTNITSLSAFDRIGAEGALRIAILDTCTSIKVLDDKGNMMIDKNELLCRGIFEEVISVILNYAEFRKDLDAIVGDIKEQIALTKSVGSVIDKVAKSAEALIAKLATSEISPETLEGLKTVAKELESVVNDSAISGLIKESQVQKRKTTGRGRKKSE